MNLKDVNQRDFQFKSCFNFSGVQMCLNLTFTAGFYFFLIHLSFCLCSSKTEQNKKGHVFIKHLLAFFIKTKTFALIKYNI